MKLFADLVKKYGLGIVLSVATLDGYRRQVLTDRNNTTVQTITQRLTDSEEAVQKQYTSSVNAALENSHNKAVIGRSNESADSYQESANAYHSNPNDVTKKQMEVAKAKLYKCMDELTKLDISEIISSLYNKYSDYLDSLTPDKIVCLMLLWLVYF